MIKKLFAALVLAAATVVGASAQEGEVTLSYGAYTQMDATDMHDGWGGVNTAWGALNFGVNFRVNKNIWIGPSYTFSSTSTKGRDASHIAYHVIMMNGRFHYYRNSIVTLYAKLGLGVDISYMQPKWDRDNYTKAYCAFQVVPIGAQFDLNRDWAMFAEAGFGAQGIFQFGFKYKF